MMRYVATNFLKDFLFCFFNFFSVKMFNPHTFLVTQQKPTILVFGVPYSKTELPQTPTFLF